MRCLLFTIVSLCCVTVGSSLYAQDVVYTRAGQLFEAEILKVSVNKIYFKKFDAGRSPAYELATKDLLRIEYENGTVDTFDEYGAITINDTTSVFTPIEEIRETEREVETDKYSYSTQYGRVIISSKILFNNREAKPTGWAPVLPLFDGSFLNYGGSFELVSKNGLCSVEIPFTIGYKNQRSKDLSEHDFVVNPDSFEAQVSVQEGEYQIANYQQAGLRFKLFPVGQEQVSYYIGPYITGSRGEFHQYSLIDTQDIFNPIFELRKTDYYSMAVGMHNGMSITPGKHITFTLGAGLGMQLLNSSGKNFQRSPSYFIDLGLGIRL